MALSPSLSFEQFLQRLRQNAYAGLGADDHRVDLEGWIHPRFDERVGGLFRGASPGSIRVLEVGSWKGLSASRLGGLLRDRGDGSFVLCIDTWLGAPEFWTWGIDDPTRGGSLRLSNGYPSVFYTFTRNMLALGLERIVVPFPISSEQGFEVLRAYGTWFDLIYVDAAHEEAAVLRDMENAWSVLAPGGILAGDDYDPEHWPGVVGAVGRFVSARGLKGVADDRLWFVPKPGRGDPSAPPPAKDGTVSPAQSAA